MSDYTADKFIAALSQRFRVQQSSLDTSAATPPDGAELELLEVDQHDAIKHAEGGEFSKGRQRVPFTLLLRGSHEHVCENQVYALTNDTCGTMDVLLNPVQLCTNHAVESHPEGRYYEVHFN